MNGLETISNLIFASDPVARLQHEQLHGRKEVGDHEAVRQLMLAVLEDGIACFQAYFFKPSRSNERLFQEAQEWIYSEDDGVFSFNTICETLGFDPDKLRQGLKGWKARPARLGGQEKKRIIANKGKCGKNKVVKSSARLSVKPMQSQQKLRRQVFATGFVQDETCEPGLAL
ncbi:MAG: hypothetical protein HY695_09820 [Deltaproteobacteria bacterium]|nr:hypothetical protein [Deltaproteobacteria bacterium]